MTWHNLQYYQDLMIGIRCSIEGNKFSDFKNYFFDEQRKGDIEPI